MISEFLAFVIAFVVTLIAVKKLIPFLNGIGLTGVDIQKADKRRIPEMGGPMILAGFVLSIFFFIWVRTFLYGTVPNIVPLFAAITTIMIITFIGAFDDIGALLKRTANEKFVKRIGLKQWQKPLLTLPAAIPLVAIMAGTSALALPFIGTVDVGILFPLIFVPIAIVGASNAFNMLAGMNGLETGMGIIMLLSMGILGYLGQEFSATILSVCLIGALLAFLVYNKYPAKIMPGDSTVYLIGSAIAVIAILGHMQKFALICFIPYFIEFVLKLRSRFKAECFGIIQKDGTLKAPYEKIYSLTHVVMKLGRFKEWQVVAILLAMETVICALAFWFII